MRSDFPAPSDLSWIRSFRRLVASRSDELVGLIEQEIGKTGFEGFASDLWPLLSACRWHERRARKWLKPRRIRGGSILQLGQRQMLYRVAYGHVAIIATWNYPVQLLGVQLIQAVAAGNRVTVKPSERCPLTQQRLLELAREAGLSSDRLAWTPATREAGSTLLNDPTLDHVVFTGSTEVGRTIAQRLAESLTPSTLELTGCDSALVLQDADVMLAARCIAYAIQLNGGATCMAPRRAIVSEAVYDRFVAALGECVSQGNPVDRYPHAETDRVSTLVHQAIEKGGRRLPVPEAVQVEGCPQVVVGCPEDAELAEGAFFGPGLAVIRASDDAQALRIHARYTKRLATAVFTAQPDRVLAECDAAKTAAMASHITFNNCVLPTGHPGAPLSGHGASGWGVSRGGPGLLAMTRPVVISKTSRWLRLPASEPAPSVQQRMRRLMGWWYRR